MPGQPPLPQMLPSGLSFPSALPARVRACDEGRARPHRRSRTDRTAECHLAEQRAAAPYEQLCGGDAAIVRPTRTPTHSSSSMLCAALRRSAAAARSSVRSTTSRSQSAAGRRSASSASPAPGSRPLARLLLRLDQPTAGRVLFDGIDVVVALAAELRRLRRRMQMVFQDPFASLNRRRTVEQTIEIPLRVHQPELGSAERAGSACASCSTSSGCGTTPCAGLPAPAVRRPMPARLDRTRARDPTRVRRSRRGRLGRRRFDSGADPESACASSRSGSGSPISSSATTSPSFATCRTRSVSCTTADRRARVARAALLEPPASVHTRSARLDPVVGELRRARAAARDRARGDGN